LSQQPVPGTCSAVRNVERAAPGFPIWPCTRWGFPCLRACAWSGGLLPHLFTLTGASCETQAVSSLWHFPSARLAAWPPACIRQPAFLRRPPPVTRHRALWSSDFPPPPDCSGESDSPPFQNQTYCRASPLGWQAVAVAISLLAAPIIVCSDNYIEAAMLSRYCGVVDRYIEDLPLRSTTLAGKISRAVVRFTVRLGSQPSFRRSRVLRRDIPRTLI